jgi:hypothetical protein
VSEHDLKALLALVERHLGSSWLDVADWLRQQNGLDAIEARLRVGDYYGVVQGIEDAARRFAAETHSQFVLAGQRGSAWLDEQLPSRLVRFDIQNERAVSAARRNQLELVHGLTQEAREKVGAIVVDGQRAGTNPREMARSIRDSIGLTSSQEAAVRSYRTALEQADFSNALSRQLSHGQSDRTIRRVQRDGSQLTNAQIDQAVERYRQNALTARAETIARTESGRNVHAGLAEAFQQAVDRGDIEAGQLVKEWIHAGRGVHSRESHREMDGKQVKWGEAFSLPSGARMQWPHDPAGGAGETANCRCTYSTTIA